MKRLTKLAALIVLVGMLTSCAMFQVPKTPEAKYLLARTEFNNMLKDYLFYKEMLPLEKQAELSATFKPYFEQTKILLDNWGAMVIIGGDTTDSAQLWVERRRFLMRLLIDNGILEVK